MNLNSPCRVSPQADANDDFYRYTTSVPCGQPIFLDVLRNDVNPLARSLSISSGITGGHTLSLVTTPSYGFSFTPVCTGNWVGFAKFSYQICGNSFVPSSDTATVYIGANPGPQLVSQSFPAPAWENTVVKLSDIVVPSAFGLNEATMIVTPILPSLGTLVYDFSLHTFTFTPGLYFNRDVTFNVTICDDPTTGSFPITFPVSCVVAHVTLVRFYFEWTSPQLGETWLMYKFQVRRCR